MSIVLFEDELVSRLYPITLGRPAFTIACGSYRLLDVVKEVGVPVGLRVRPHLAALVAADMAECVGAAGVEGEGALLLNARAVPLAGLIGKLKRLLKAGRPCVARSGGAVAAVLLPPGAAIANDFSQSALDALCGDRALPDAAMEIALLDYPHDIIRHHAAALAENLEHRLATGRYRELAPGVYAAEGAALGEFAAVDCAKGPIVLEEGAQVGPHAFLRGPLHIGHRARVNEHASLKDGVALGHTTKVGGEVECSIIEPYSNKQHYGFLGHSYIGSWVNLGAGTTNSDLKNTYGPITVEQGGQRISTDMQFMGCVVGDYAKTAINTSVFTGKIIGACSMVYGIAAQNVPSFVNYARLLGHLGELPVDVAVKTQARMFARRALQQRACDVAVLEAMHALTAHERIGLSQEPPRF